MKDEVLKFIKNNNLINDGDKVLVAFSGGPDSVCLLNLLTELKDELKIELGAAHINHLLRGYEAFKDEEYGEAFCEKIGVPFYVHREDIKKYSDEYAISTETAGRKVRYEFFDKISKEYGYNKIATAHNANDQVETILMRIARGTGIEGLCGIPVMRENKFIRPILGIDRKSIERYCEIFDLKPRIDESNSERDYSRNKIRLDIIPYLQENFNPNLVASVNRMIGLLNQDSSYIEQECEKKFEKYVSINNNTVVVNKKVKDEHFSVLSRILRKALGKISKSEYDFEMKHIEDAIKLFDFETNKEIHLPNNVVVKNVYGDIELKLRVEKKIINEEIVIDKNNLKNRYEFEKNSIIFDIIEKDINFNNNKYIKYFDYDKINGNIIIRKRRNGDKIQPLGMNGNKKIKDIFINSKIPTEKRDLIPIVQFGDNIGWIVGVKTSELFKVTKDTKKILRITFQGKDI
ncbi:MAG: tRNA lysidine(34) synthetase TilS [Clostridium sp.]